MKTHLLVQQRLNGGGAGTHLVQGLGLGHGKRPGAGKMDKKKVVLHQITQEALPWEGSIAHPLDKGVPGVIAPCLARRIPP